VLAGLNVEQLKCLEKDIDMYLSLERNKENLDFWETMLIICNDRRHKLQPNAPSRRAHEATSVDVDRIFESKTLPQLEALEKKIKSKLRSNEDIDVEYWENLLLGLKSWKAKVKLRAVSQSILSSQAKAFQEEQAAEAERVKSGLQEALQRAGDSTAETATVDYSVLDPEPALKARTQDKGIPVHDLAQFKDNVNMERNKIRKLGFIPGKRVNSGALIATKTITASASQPMSGSNDRTTAAMYEREVARGVGENEEVFVGEEEVSTTKKDQWADKYRPRKPRYFNRVQMGYEWNKYNQTHFDQDNPPPKVVQGYKFNIFYPELIDKTKAPTYKIERENGRKRGESFAPAGEEDTCLIRFVAGPPYEDVAFRIVDREWDYSAKRERGFRSSFDKGILQLHFQFKKIFYRK
jgi:hypothetical protein